MREEADVLNALWDFAARRYQQTGHPYYIVLAQDMRAVVRSYGKPGGAASGTGEGTV